MYEIGAPVLFALFLWWASTGAVLFLVSLRPTTFRWSMVAATAIAGVCCVGIVLVEDIRTPWAAYVGFACGLGLWAWHEMSFLFGFVTGPRHEPASLQATGWRRFRHALQTLLYHELAILVTALVLIWVLADALNQTALWAFVLLWIMRLSAKLNIFLGVPNMNEEFLPRHLAFLRSYFTKRAMNVLFPLSVTLGTVTLFWLLKRGLAVDASAFEAASCLMLATMLALAVLEHWFLVLPVPDAVLWRWAMAGGDRAPAPPAQSSGIGGPPLPSPNKVSSAVSARSNAAASLPRAVSSLPSATRILGTSWR